MTNVTKNKFLSNCWGFPPPLTRWFTVQLQIEEISRKLRTGDLGIPLNPEERFERYLSTKNKQTNKKSCNPLLKGLKNFSKKKNKQFKTKSKDLYEKWLHLT